ncbi:MAG: hypothetical protein H7248_10025 [Microbacteriaceae bacterium]|nr:hypothetical protein [Microbacteriaceae bacterium]
MARHRARHAPAVLSPFRAKHRSPGVVEAAIERGVNSLWLNSAVLLIVLALCTTDPASSRG